MGANTPPERPCVPVGATRNARVSFKGQLDSGELLTGTPTIVEVGTSDLTITNKALNSGTIQVGSDASVLALQAVTYTMAGMLLATAEYQIKITVSTDAGQVLVAFDWFDVLDE